MTAPMIGDPAGPDSGVANSGRTHDSGSNLRPGGDPSLSRPGRSELVVRVHGTPAKQGSKDFKGMRGRHAVMVEADEKLPAWRKAVIAAAENAKLATAWLMLNEPVELTAVVYLPRPKTVKRAYPTGRQDGDEDKFLRAIQDALSLAGVYYDDSLVVDGHIHKRYADGRPPGATITIRAMGEQGSLL